MQSNSEFVTQFPKAGERFSTFIEVLVDNKAQDIASSLVDALYKSDAKAVGKPIMQVFKRSGAIVTMGKKFREFTKQFESALT
jgi:hypothetical protein